jgi:soluble lytic murein transglycosylase-like protein
MTLQHLFRNMLVAGAAIVALVLAGQARAESGEESVYSVQQPELPAGGAEAVASVDPATAPATDPDTAAPLVGTRSRAGALEAKNALAYRPLVARVSSDHGLPFELADAVVRIESRYNPGARNGPNVGLMQINALTAKSLGYGGSANGLLEPETNLTYGLKYLAMAYKLAGGDMCGTVLRYQAGHRATTMTQQAAAYCAHVKTIIAQTR